MNAKTGDVVYQERLSGTGGRGGIYASVVVADNKLYIPSRFNGTLVLAAKPKFEQIALNELKEDRSMVNAGLVVSGRRLLLRSDRFLYCIGAK